MKNSILKKKIKIVFIDIMIIIVLLGMKLFSDKIYFRFSSDLSQEEFYEHFNLNPVTEESGLRESFHNLIYDNPLAIMFRNDKTYTQRYYWTIKENEVYAVSLSACDTRNGYNLERIGNDRNYDVAYTYFLDINGIDIYLEMVRMELTYTIYDYRMAFKYEDKYYSLTLYGIDDPYYQSHDGLNEYYYDLITRLIDTFFG